MIVVVGGGISGLVLGYELDRSGADVLVLEESFRPGGVVRSLGAGSRLMELGPQRARLTPPLARLVDELGLRHRIRTGPQLPLFVYADGALRPVPTRFRSLLTTSLVGWGDRLRLLAEPLTDGLRPGETAAEFFTRKLGRRVYRRLAGPLFGGLYATDPADMQGRHALATVLQTLGIERSLVGAARRAIRAGRAAPPVTFDSGMEALTEALAAALGDRMRLGEGVRRLEAASRGVRVVTDSERIHAEHVVLACPPQAAAACLQQIAPRAARRIEQLRYNRIAVVQLESDVDFRGQGVQVALGTTHATHGVTAQDALFGRTGLYAAFLGGAKRPDLVERPDAEIGDLAVAEFREMIGGDARPIHVHRTSMPAWDGSWSSLDGLILPPGVSICGNWNGRAGLSSRVVAATREASALATTGVRGLPTPAGFGG